jgi:hypothetical protein
MGLDEYIGLLSPTENRSYRKPDFTGVWTNVVKGVHGHTSGQNLWTHLPIVQNWLSNAVFASEPQPQHRKI